MAKDKTIILEAVGTRLEVQLPAFTNPDLAATPAGTWDLIPGAASVNDSGGDAPSQSSKNFLQSQTSVGAATPPPINIGLDPWIETHPVAAGLLRALREKKAVNYRKTTAQELVDAIEAGVRQLTIAAGGAVTFAGSGDADEQQAQWTADDYSVGLALYTPGNSANALWPVKAVADDGALTVVKADLSPVAAGDIISSAEDYAIVQPSEQSSGRCRVVSINTSGETDGHYTASLVLQPRQFIPPAIPVYA